jgi:uncharacterized phosphatase
MRTTIILIRHGQTDWNYSGAIQGRGEVPLNSTGINQLIETGKKLQKNKIHIDEILASPLSRAIHSAKLIQKEISFSKPVLLEPLAIERDFGSAEGTIMTKEFYDKVLADEVKGMESTDHLKKRSWKCLSRLAQEYPGKTLLLCSHSHFIKSYFCQIDSSIHLNTHLDNGAFNWITFEDGKISEYHFNQQEIILSEGNL